MSADPREFDHRWIKALKAPHRIVLDVHALGAGVPLMRAANYLDTVRDEFSSRDGSAQVVLALHAGAMSIAFDDAAWEKYQFGERAGAAARDPASGKPYTRNIFASEAPGDPWAAVAVPALQRRGATFLFCNNVLRNLTASLARRRGETPEVVRAALIASFLPDVVLVPAVVAATVVAQENGCAYALIN
jgi:intracellular sulfur oxidation DsrE/DsrF family protein